jgi:hypothetical protein
LIIRNTDQLRLEVIPEESENRTKK